MYDWPWEGLSTPAPYALALPCRDVRQSLQQAAEKERGLSSSLYSTEQYLQRTRQVPGAAACALPSPPH